MSKPDKLDVIWASTGTIVDPGDTKFAAGWEAEIPPYQHFNHVLNKTSQMLDHINTQGIPEWDELTAYTIGAKVLYNGIEYKCTIAGASTSTPDLLVNWKQEVNQDLKTTDDVEFNSVSTDTITEKTMDNGVIIEDVELKDGVVKARKGVFDILPKFNAYGIQEVAGVTSLDLAAINRGITVALAPLTDTDFVIASDDTDDGFGTYRYTGAGFTLVGNWKTTASSPRSVATLSSTRIVVSFIDGSLAAYDFDGTDWTTVGSSFATGNSFNYITGLTSSRIAGISSDADVIQAYDFDGTDWTTVGSSIARTCTNGRIEALSSNEVVYVDTIDENLRHYVFNGSTWEEVGTAFGISGLSNAEIGVLNSTDFVLTDNTLAFARIYRFNGTFSQVGQSYTIANSYKTIAVLTPELVIFYARNLEEVNAYQIDYGEAPPYPVFN